MGNLKTTLLSIEYERSNWTTPQPPTHIVYTMRKVTPVGVLEAHITVKFFDFISAGATAMDGRMFNALGETLNREEMKRVLEMGANYNFGNEEVVAA